MVIGDLLVILTLSCKDSYFFTTPPQVAVLDLNLSSILYITDCVSSSSSPIISVSWIEFKNTHGLVKGLKHSETEVAVKPEDEIIFILTKDAKFFFIDGGNGKMIHPHPWHLKKEETALSMYIIGKYHNKARCLFMS